MIGYAASVEDLRSRFHRRRPGALSLQRLDRWPADRAADRGRRACLPRVGDDAARPADRRRAGARACGHRREARDQRRDGGLPADAFPGRRDRVDGDDAGAVPAPWRHRQHRRLRRAGRAERADPPGDRRIGDLQCAGQQRPRHRRDRPRHPALPDQPDGCAARRDRPLDPRAIPASSATASQRTRRILPGSRSPSSAASSERPRRSPSWRRARRDRS